MTGDARPTAAEPKREQMTCPYCNGVGVIWDAVYDYPSCLPCGCDDGKVTRLGIPLSLDLRAAYA